MASKGKGCEPYFASEMHSTAVRRQHEKIRENKVLRELNKRLMEKKNGSNINARRNPVTVRKDR